MHNAEIHDDRDGFTVFMTYIPRLNGYRFADCVKMFQLKRYPNGLPSDQGAILWRTPGTKARYSDYGIAMLGEAAGVGRAPLLSNPLPSPELDGLPRLTIALITPLGVMSATALTTGSALYRPGYSATSLVLRARRSGSSGTVTGAPLCSRAPPRAAFFNADRSDHIT